MKERTTRKGWPECKAGYQGSQAFKQGIDPRNLRIASDAAVRVRLEASWPQLATRLHELGDSYILTRNAAAVLGAHRSMPQLMVCQHGHAKAPDQSLAYDLQEWHQASAVLEHFAGSQVLGFEIAGESGEAFHRVCVSDQSNRERFAELVRQFQSGRHQPVEWRANEDACEQGGWVERLRFRKYQLTSPLSGVAVPVGQSFARSLMSHAANSNLEVESRVYTPGAVQAVTARLESWCSAATWSHLSGPDFSLHVETSAVAEWWLVASRVGQANGSLLEAYDARDHLLMTLGPTEESFQSWQRWIGERGLRN